MIGKTLIAATLFTVSPWAASDEVDRHIGVCVTHLWLTNQTAEGERLLKRVTSSKDMRRSADQFAALIRKDVDKAMDQAAKSCKIINQPLFSDDTPENG